MKKLSSYMPGFLGGMAVVFIVVAVLFSLGLHNHKIYYSKSYVIYGDSIKSEILSADIGNVIHTDSTLRSLRSELRHSVIEELRQEKILLTPQEYTNNVVDYYNSLLMILSVLLGAFSIIGFVYIKSMSKDLIEERLSSEEFTDKIAELMIGKVQPDLRKMDEKIVENTIYLENKIAHILDWEEYSEDSEESSNQEIINS